MSKSSNLFGFMQLEKWRKEEELKRTKRKTLKQERQEQQRAHAKQAMWEYYKQFKDQYPSSIKQYREQIIEQICQGISPESAFDAID